MNEYSIYISFMLDLFDSILILYLDCYVTVLGAVWIEGPFKKNNNFWKLFLELDLQFTEAFTVELCLI